MLDRQERHHLVMPEDDLTFRAEHEADVEEPAGEFRMPGLRLGHQVHVPLPGQRAEVVRLRPGDVDRALPGEVLVVEVEYLVVEALQRALWHGDQPDRQVQAGQPRSGLNQVRQMLEVDTDLVATANPAHGRHEADGLIGLDHDIPLRFTPIPPIGPIALDLPRRLSCFYLPGTHPVRNSQLEPMHTVALTLPAP